MKLYYPNGTKLQIMQLIAYILATNVLFIIMSGYFKKIAHLSLDIVKYSALLAIYPLLGRYDLFQIGYS